MLIYFFLWRWYKLVNPGCWFCCISNPYQGIRYTRYSRASQPYSLIFYYCPISGMQCDTRWPASYDTATQETSIDFQTKLSVQQGVCRGILNRKQPVILLDSAPLLFWAWAGEWYNQYLRLHANTLIPHLGDVGIWKNTREVCYSVSSNCKEGTSWSTTVYLGRSRWPFTKKFGQDTRPF